MPQVAMKKTYLSHTAFPNLLLHSPSFLRRRDEARIIMLHEILTICFEAALPLFGIAYVAFEEDEIVNPTRFAARDQIAKGFSRQALEDSGQQALAHLSRQDDRIGSPQIITHYALPPKYIEHREDYFQLGNRHRGEVC